MQYLEIKISVHDKAEVVLSIGESFHLFCTSCIRLLLRAQLSAKMNLRIASCNVFVFTLRLLKLRQRVNALYMSF